MHHDNDSRLMPPIVTRLRRAGRKIDIGNLDRFSGPDQISDRAANDDVASGFTVDTVHEIRPTDGEIARACMKQEEHGIGLRFDKLGRITEWRAHDKSGDPILDKDGNERWFPAREGYRHSKGSRRKSLNDLAEKSAQHLSLRGSAIFQERYRRSAVPSYGEDFCRLRAAHWVRAFEPANDNRRDIDRLGIGAGVSFDDAWTNAGLYPACRIPRYMAVIARGAEFVAGKTKRNALTSEGSFVGAPDAVENAVIAAMDAPTIEARLGDHVGILNDALDGMTARDAAVKRGWGDSKSSEQRAVRAQDRALVALDDAYRKAA